MVCANKEITTSLINADNSVGIEQTHVESIPDNIAAESNDQISAKLKRGTAANDNNNNQVQTSQQVNLGELQVI